MFLKDEVALAAPAIVWCFIFAIVVTTFFCPLLIPALLGSLLVLINSHYECYAYKGLFRTRSEDIGRPISVVSYNVNLAYKDLSTPEKADNIADYLLEKDADIVLLQEYNPQIFPALHQKLENKYPYGSPYHLADRYKAVFSKYPISDYIQLKDYQTNGDGVIGDEDRRYLPICGMTVVVNGNPLYMINCHLHSNNFSPALRQLRHNEISLVSFVKIIFCSLLQGIKEREKQVNNLRIHLRGCKQPIIICGDMNDVSGSSVMKMMRGKTLFDAWWTKGIGLGFTLSMKVARWRLDHILYSKDIKIDSVMVDKYDMSDHRPLFCTFYLNPHNHESSI